ncbi:galactose-6-phosphate isomerase subunit LacA [Aerococcus tenax]|uniref:galactose-6-phosphate isomerase subunit LacA n=1 Tax=Aerococcus tenax TaxID=3078812 RepID=UPI0018A7CA6C|nr:galactose-6-phosphate isomerase subunit LacA [Aerococcus tenax]
MKVIIGADKGGFELKNKIKKYLEGNDYDVVDVTEDPAKDFVESTNKILDKVLENDSNLGVAVDAYGVGSFMAGTKHKKAIVAELSDERTAYMTREHNNARMITLGQEVVGEELAFNIVREFLSAEYAGGRHQVRVDMLNEMC